MATAPTWSEHFTGTDLKWFTFTNGSHIDSLDPYTFDRWYDFLDLFVAHQAPIINSAAVQKVAPLIFRIRWGSITQRRCPPTRSSPNRPTQAALAAFEALPEIRVLFDNGAGASPTGTVDRRRPVSRVRAIVLVIPDPGTVADYWYLGPDGTLTDQAPSAQGVDSYTSNASALPLTDYSGSTVTGGLWAQASAWDWNWEQSPAGSAVSYVSAPLSEDTAVIGAGAVHLWVESSTPNVDFQATLSEISPSGNETFVQNGWLRADDRALSTNSDNMLERRARCSSPC